jgi:cytochrome oxidase Cu insertion factor (SCO1/SenC/PrrC family)
MLLHSRRFFHTEKKNIHGVKPVFISVDPRRDTVGQMKNYSQDFHPSIAYLTGTKDQVAVAAKAYRVYFSKVRAITVRECCNVCKRFAVADVWAR